MIFAFVIFFAFAGLLAVYTYMRSRKIDADYQADGQFAKIDGVRLHYHFCDTACPEALPLVFIHGASGNAYDQITAFARHFERRHPLLFVDRPGLGFSDRDFGLHASPRMQARLIAGLLDQLKIDRCLVVGHSLGGAVAAALGLEVRGKVKGLVFVAPATHPWPGGVSWYYSVAALPVIGRLFCWTLTVPVAERLVASSLEHVFEPSNVPVDYVKEIRLPLLFRPDSFRANAQDIAHLKSNVREQSKDYGNLDQPTVVVTGTGDTVVWPIIHSEGLVRDLPNARLVVLQDAGHMLHHTHGTEIAVEIDGLIQQVERS